MNLALSQNPVVQPNLNDIKKSSLEQSNMVLMNGSNDAEIGGTTKWNGHNTGQNDGSESSYERNLVVKAVAFLSTRMPGLCSCKVRNKNNEVGNAATLEDVARQVTQQESRWNLFKKEPDDSHVVTKLTRDELDGVSLENGKAVEYGKMKEASKLRGSLSFDWRLSKEPNMEQQHNQGRQDDSWLTKINASFIDELNSSKCGLPQCHDSVFGNQSYPQYHGRPYILQKNSERIFCPGSSAASVEFFPNVRKKSLSNPIIRRLSMLSSARSYDYDDIHKHRSDAIKNIDDIYIPEEPRFGFIDRLREEAVPVDHNTIPRGNIPGTVFNNKRRNRFEKMNSLPRILDAFDDIATTTSIDNIGEKKSRSLRRNTMCF